MPQVDNNSFTVLFLSSASGLLSAGLLGFFIRYELREMLSPWFFQFKQFMFFSLTCSTKHEGLKLSKCMFKGLFFEEQTNIRDYFSHFLT